MGMDGGGGGKLPYSYAGAGHHQDGKLVKSFSRVEPRKFGMGLVAGFLLVTCAYFSTAKFDAIHIAMVSPISTDAAGIGPLATAAADTSKQQFDLGVQQQDRNALSKEGSRADVFDKDDGNTSSSGPDSGRDAPLEDTRRDEASVGGSGDAGGVDASPAAAANPAGGGEVPAKDDDATAAVLPPVSLEEAANGTQESGVLEDEELRFQEAVAKPPSKKSNDSAAAGATVVHSDPAILPAPVQQIPPATQEVKALADQQIPAVSEIKQAGILMIPSYLLA